MQNIDVTKLGDLELKAIKADLFEERDRLQQVFTIINNELNSRNQKAQGNKKMEEETKVETPEVDTETQTATPEVMPESEVMGTETDEA